MLDLKSRLRRCLKLAGKGESKVASVFGVNAAAAHEAVLHLREGAPGVPVWLFTTVAPLPETEPLCERIYQNKSALALIADAECHLWQHSVALSVATWTGSGASALKIAPFLIPPFRVLILNRYGGFFSGTLSNMFAHIARVQVPETLDRARARFQGAFHQARVRSADILNGLSKLIAATGWRVAGTMLHPHLALFQRLHGDQPLMLEVDASSRNDVEHFEQTGPHWNGADLEKAAMSSNARWILWLDSGEADSISDGAPLFDDVRTFAASRQVHFRAWKKAIMPAAPFRTLQAGEAARVLAPLSRSILVDRKKLLALGIPRCSMPGTAWMILFWKAAAAGWRSYSLGQEARTLSEQPDAPVQDTAFAVKTLLDPSLRPLSPREEDLSRGNISFSAAHFASHANWNSERLKVLIVSPFLPYPLAHGGAVRIYNLCRELSDRVDFSLIAMRESNDQVNYDKLHEVFREVQIVDKDERPSAGSDLPAQVSSSESSSLRALISQLSRKLLPDLIQIEFTHFAGFRDSAPGIPALLVEHDLTFSLYRQLAETNPSAESWGEYNRWLAFERKWLESYEGVWTVSEDDRVCAIEEGGRTAERTFAIANGVDLNRFRPSDPPEGKPEILYVGSFRHLPNIIGFERLCDEIMPRVWAKAPDTCLRVVAGPEHERFWQQLGRTKDLRALDPRVEVHGFVEDLRPLYARAHVVAVPLEVSAGTNIKVLEAMACGKAIVSTPVGCGGLHLRDGYDVAIRNDWGAFADALCSLFSANSLGARARRTAETQFSWTTIANRAYESYTVMAGNPSYRKRKANRSLSAVRS